MNFNNYNIILASNSPRRQKMLRDIGVKFTIQTKDIDESYPKDLSIDDVALFLAEKKASAFYNDISENDLLITADTIVVIDNRVLGKPKDRQDAFKMLQLLSGKSHKVISGVSLYTSEKKKSFSCVTEVFFKDLTSGEIDYYIDTYKPFDKAGAYGIQEWIGYIGVERIDGSYFNVVGLPIQRVYTELCNF